MTWCWLSDMAAGLPLVHPNGIARLGLGCSRIASLSTKPNAAQIAALLETAYDGGIRFFDTADVYGQGDSERRLSPIAARPGVMICTKAGLTLGVSQRLVRLVKPVLRPVLQHLRKGAKAAADLRQSSQRTDFDPDRLERCLQGSLRRLGRRKVEVFLLHNPSLADLGDGRLYDFLAGVRDRGLADRVGVSCDTLDDAGRIVATGRVDAVEVPLSAAALPQASGFLDTAHAAGVFVIAREVFADGVPDTGGVAAVLAPLLTDRRIAVVLTGTTSRDHLVANMEAARKILASEGNATCT